MNITKKYSTVNTTYSKNRPVKYIVWHYTAGVTSKPGAAINSAGWFANPAAQCSADFIVDDRDIVQFNGDIKNRYCWAVGGNKYNTKGGELYGIATNKNCISIEICSNNSSGKITYPNDPRYTLTEASLNNALELTYYLMEKYNIDADHVIRHYSVNGKECPGVIGWNKESGSEAEWIKWHNKIKNKSGSSSTPTTSEPVYRVRKSWADEDSQIFAGTLEGAKKSCKTGYSVYDEKGKEVYSNKPKDNVAITSNQDKIWMGWTKRETNKEGLRGIHGDSGKAYGLQFDYRYGLLDFLQYCINYNPSRYADFKKFIDMGKGNSKLVYNKELGKLWQKYYDAYTEEFEQLQYTCAYINYYEPVKKYIKSYGIDLDNHSPALKGTAWSMSFRSGQKSAADKFSSCKDSMSDDKIMQIVYSSYGTADSNRWTKAGQWGDALDALTSNSYSIVNKSMTSNNTSVPSQSQSLTPYRVGTAWKNGKCQNQIGAYDVISNAKSKADDQAKSKKKTYKVFDASGNVVYTAKYTSTASKFEPYNVKVKVPNLRIRKTPNGEIVTKNGKEVYTGIGVFEIVEEKKAGNYTWGLLKSKAGWIALDPEYVEKI